MLLFLDCSRATATHASSIGALTPIAVSRPENTAPHHEFYVFLLTFAVEEILRSERAHIRVHNLAVVLSG